MLKPHKIIPSQFLHEKLKAWGCPCLFDARFADFISTNRQYYYEESKCYTPNFLFLTQLG